MGDQPVFSSRAHVFYIEPNSKKEWTPGCQGAVPINIFYDAGRQGYRVISIVESKAIVNSALSSESTFIKTSHKFGQWLDTKTGVLYGLGFENENDLNSFSSKFNQYKGQSSGPAGTKTGKKSYGGEEDEPIIRDQKKSDNNNLYSTPAERDNDVQQFQEELENAEAELEQANDQLEQQVKDGKKKDDEISTLKKNNAKLTSALKESAANVEEWKKLLHKYREESLEAKNKISELEADARERDYNQQGSAQNDERVDELERVINEKNREIDILNKELMASQIEGNRLQKDNQRQQEQLYNMSGQVEKQSQDAGQKRRETQETVAQINSKLQELQMLTGTLQTQTM